MAGGQPLPIELVLEIMLYLYVDSREKPHRYFHNLSLVCKMWRPYAQRLLFRNARLYDPGNTYGFLEATHPDREGQGQFRLGGCVRTVEITAMSREMMSLIPYILRHCPNLYELSAAFHSSLDVASVQNPTTLPPRMKGLQAFDYNKLPLPQIQALRIDSHVEGTYLSEKLIRIWPDVRHLVLNGHALHEILGPPSNTNQTSVGMLKLRELQLGKIRTTKGPIMNTTMINLLLCSSAGHLTILDLLGMDSSGITYLEEVLVRHGRHLRSLRLPQLDIHIRTPWLRHCTSLEEIMIDSYPPKDVRANLPKEKLVHASFSNKAGQENYSLKPMIQWLESLPAVETFTWITRKGNKKNNSADAADLKQACARMGIRLRLLTVMTVQLPQELIEPPTFPRDELMTPVWR